MIKIKLYLNFILLKKMFNSPSNFQFTSLPNTSNKYNPTSRYKNNNYQNFQFGPNSNYTNSFRNNLIKEYYILLTGINERNDLMIYNFFAKFGEIQYFYKNYQDKIAIIKYKSDEIIRIATASWEKEGNNFNGILLKLINEDEVQNYVGNNNQRNYQNYYSNNNDYYNNTVIENKSNFYKFLDVLFNT